jgi:hypothetical protein
MKSMKLIFLFQLCFATSLKHDIQVELDRISDKTGYSFSLGFVNRDHSFGMGAGPRTSPILPVKVDGHLD